MIVDVAISDQGPLRRWRVSISCIDEIFVSIYDLEGAGRASERVLLR